MCIRDRCNQAYIIFEENPEKVEDILKLLREASKLDPDEIIYYQMITKYLIHQGNYEEALSTIEKTIDLPQSLNEQAHNYLLLGIANDLISNRQEALSYYRKIEKLMTEKVDNPWFKVNRVIGAFAQKYTIKPFGKKNLKDRTVLIEFSQGAGIE